MNQSFNTSLDWPNDLPDISYVTIIACDAELCRVYLVPEYFYETEIKPRIDKVMDEDEYELQFDRACVYMNLLNNEPTIVRLSYSQLIPTNLPHEFVLKNPRILFMPLWC